MDSLNNIFKVIDYMNQNIYDNLTLDDLCAVSGYTKSHLCYLFKLYIGDTPNKYFYKLKLRNGANLLFGNENILNIAIQTGFGSHEAFSRAFKKEFGMTPLEYRELYMNGLSKLNDLNDIELNMIFSPSPAYRLYLGLDKYGKYYDVYQSLIKKGYIDYENLDLTIDGIQLRDKYLWDCSNIIIEFSKTSNTLNLLYENTLKLIYIPNLLFARFVYDLVDNGKIRNVFNECSGSNCFQCDTLKATLNDDDELRKKVAINLRDEFNVEVDFKKVFCLGCTFNNGAECCGMV